MFYVSNDLSTEYKDLQLVERTQDKLKIWLIDYCKMIAFSLRSFTLKLCSNWFFPRNGLNYKCRCVLKKSQDYLEFLFVCWTKTFSYGNYGNLKFHEIVSEHEEKKLTPFKTTTNKCHCYKPSNFRFERKKISIFV